MLPTIRRFPPSGCQMIVKGQRQHSVQNIYKKLHSTNLFCDELIILRWKKNGFFKKDFQAQKIFCSGYKKIVLVLYSIYSCGTKLLIFSDYMRLCYITSVFLPNQRRPKILFRAQLRRKYLIS